MERTVIMKRKFGTLAGSILIVANANALVLGDSVIAVFNTMGNGSYYQVLGSTSDLLAGIGFQQDVSAAQAVLGGTIEEFALIALAPDDGSIFSPFPGHLGTYNYDEMIYVDNNGGLITTSNVDAANASSNTDAIQFIEQLTAFLQNASLGYNPDGSLGDFDSNFNVANLLTTSPSTVALNAQQATGTTTIPKSLEITSPIGSGSLVLDNISASFSLTAVPVPTAAWLFGSALVGFGFIRRKH